MLLTANLYGHPAGSRQWSITRDEFLLRHFNLSGSGWTCERALMDPCLFRFTKKRIDAEGNEMRFKPDALGEFILDENLGLVLHAEGFVKIDAAFGRC